MADFRSTLKRFDPQVLLRTAVLFAIGVLPCAVLGIPGAALVLVVGWAAAAAIFPEYKLTALALPAGSAVGMTVMLPFEFCWLPALWAGLGTFGILVPEKDHVRRIIRWGLMTAGIVCAALAALAIRYPGETGSGIAQELVSWISSSSQRDMILLSAYQNGLASADASLLPAATNPAMMFRAPELSEEAANELLFSLRTTFESLYRVHMPNLIVSFIGLTTALCTVAPDEWLRRRGLDVDPLPQIEDWKLPPRMAIAAVCGLFLSIVPYLLDSAIPSYAVTLCVGAATWAFMVQGAGLLAFLLKKRGTRRSSRYTCALILAVLLPQVLEIMGVIDQITTLRNRSDAE